MPLPELNSVESCAKCGSPTISHWHGKRAGMEYSGSPERQVCMCWRCGYWWNEAVLEVPHDA